MELRSVKSDRKKTKIVEVDGAKVLITEEDGQAGRVSPTKLTEQSDEAVCRICWGTERED